MPVTTFALFVAAWDLADRGVRELFTWAADQCINTIYLASEYHAGWFLHPHARTRKVLMAEEGTCYFSPSAKAYQNSPLRPAVASISRDHDWVGEAAACARDLNLRLYLWTVCLHNARLGQLHPHAACRNAFGDVYPHALCPSHSDVREYVRSLVLDQASQYRPDGFFLEATQYRGRSHGHHHERDGLPLPDLERRLLDLSFSETDISGAVSAGIDAARLQQRVRKHLDGYFLSDSTSNLAQFYESVPELAQYESWQQQVCESLLIQIKTDLSAFSPRPILLGVQHEELDQHYVAVYNRPANGIESTIRAAATGSNASRPVIAGVRLGFNPSPTPAVNSVAQANEIAREIAGAGAAGMAFYIYGETPTNALGWMAPAIEAARGNKIAPIGQKLSSSMGTASPVRVGLIGTGMAGVRHMEVLGRVAGVELIGVADVKHAKARQAADRLGIDFCCDDPDELLDRLDVDLIVIATPPSMHRDLALRTLGCGKHLLLEKPFGMNAGQTSEILQAASRHSGRVVAGALVHRYNGTRFAARDLIRAGAIGSVRWIRHSYGVTMYHDPRFAVPSSDERGWLTDPAQASGGLLPSASIHSISAIGFMLDHPVFRTVQAQVRGIHPKAIPGIEDDVLMSITMAGGAELQFEESWAVDQPFETLFYGDHGWLKLSGPNFEDISLSGECGNAVPEAFAAFCDGRRINARPHECDHLAYSSFQGLAVDVVGACRGQRPETLPDMRHALNMRQVIDAAVRSSSENRSEIIPWALTPIVVVQKEIANRERPVQPQYR